MRVIRVLFPYLLSFLVFLYLVTAGYLQINRPDLGFQWGYSSELVYRIDKSQTNLEEIQIGDRVISGDGAHPSEIYKEIHLRQLRQVEVLLERNGDIYSIMAEVRTPPFSAIIGGMIILFIAFVFLGFGNFVFAFSRETRQSIYFLLFSLCCAVTLASGSIAFFAPEWVMLLMFSGIIWGGFTLVQLHLDFPSRMEFGYRHTLQTGLLLVGSILSCFNISFYFLGYKHLLVGVVSIVVLAVEAVFVIMLLVQSYQKARSIEDRNRTGILVLTLLFCLLPILLFSMVPQLISGKPVVPFDYSFLGFLIFPISYGYVIVHYQWSGINRALNRGAALGLVILIIGGFYGLIVSIMLYFFPGIFDSYPIVEMAITLVVAALSSRIYSAVHLWVNRILYGTWFDYRSAVSLINNRLKDVDADEQAIIATLCQVVGKALLLEFTAVLLPSHRLIYSLFNHSSPNTMEVDGKFLEPIFATLRQTIPNKAVEMSHLRPFLKYVLPAGYGEKICLAIPLDLVCERDKGILILGPRRDGSYLERTDLDILELATCQAQISLDKARLLAENQEYTRENIRLHRLVLNAGERERKNLSHHLHDEIIQPLAGLNFKLAEMRKRASEDDDLKARQDEVQVILRELRNVCANLRPPVLDNVGLVSAFQSKIVEIEYKSNLSISLFIEGNDHQILPDTIKAVAYRFLQEGLANIQKHAEAECVEVRLEINHDLLTVSILDDGKGFIVPGKLSYFERNNHIGLASLEEDIHSLHGHLEVKSDPGEGSCLIAIFPLGNIFQ